MTSQQNHKEASHPVHAVHADHGSTPAAWTTVVIITRAFTLGTWAVVWANWPLFWVSVALVVLGGIVGKVMSMMGFGKKSQ